MKKELIEYVESDSFKESSLRDFKKYLGISKKNKRYDIISVIKELELEGFLYEDKDGLYKRFPSNFFVGNIEITKKGNAFINVNNSRYKVKDLNGALGYDKVIVKLDGNSAIVEKVLVRNMPYVVCEVRLDDDNKKYLYPINTGKGLRVTIGTLNMKKRINGERILVKVSEEEFDGMYSATYVKSIGYVNEPDIDYKTIAYSHGFDLEFPDEVIEEISKFSLEVSELDKEGRVDLTKDVCFTIDGVDCKDMDDAVSISRKVGGGYILKVHIAHVSHYVKFGSNLFKEAVKRGNSVYFPDSVIPMLPEVLSNELCSLNPYVDRLTRTFEIELDDNAKVTSYKTYKSVINSKMKMNYDDVYDVITTGKGKKEYQEFKEQLFILKELSEKLTNNKLERGYTSFDGEELKFKRDNLGNTLGIKVENDNISHEMIENSMLLPNELVTLLYPEYPFGYRDHENPSRYSLNMLIKEIKDMGYPTRNLKNIKANFLIQRILNNFKDKEEYPIISKMVLTSMKLAYYSIENKGHFGLAIENGYAHYTSPIRRVFDLTIHNLLDMYEEGNIDIQRFNELSKMLDEIFKHASYMERQAEKAEYEVDMLQLINFVKKHIGENKIGFIDNIDGNGIRVLVPGLMDGVVMFSDMVENTYMLPSGRIKGVESGRVYKKGHKVLLEIKEASYIDKAVYYSLLDDLTLSEAEEKKLKKVL